MGYIYLHFPFQNTDGGLSKPGVAEKLGHGSLGSLIPFQNNAKFYPCKPNSIAESIFFCINTSSVS